MTMHNGLWLPQPAAVRLSRHDIHVWRASLDLDASRLQTLEDTLSLDELTRARRFYFQKDRRHFIAARGLLRTILSRYLDVEPAHLHFCYGSHGKPALTSTFSKQTFSFNLSHSGGLALFAVTRGRAIGIDLERICEDVDCDQIARAFLSRPEHDALCALPEHLKQKAFFSYWTRKEAYLKARGDGLTHRPDEVELPLTSDAPAMLLNTQGEPVLGSHWSILTLLPGDCYVAALAAEGHHWQLALWQWPE